MVVFRDTQTAVSDTTCQYTDCEESATINLATSTYSGCVIVAAFCAEHGQSQLGSCQVTVLSLTNAEYRCVRQGDQAVVHPSREPQSLWPPATVNE